MVLVFFFFLLLPWLDTSDLEVEGHGVLGWNQLGLGLALQRLPARLQQRVANIPPSHLEWVCVVEIQHAILQWELNTNDQLKVKVHKVSTQKKGVKGMV